MRNDLDRVHPEQRRLRPAYTLWALTGFLGAHRIYLRRPLGFLRGGLFGERAVKTECQENIT